MEQQSPWKIRNYRVERKGVERNWLVVAEKWKQQSAGVEDSCNSATFKQETGGVCSRGSRTSR